MGGPLSGVKIIEVASLGPGPFAAMLLADMGAEVVRVDRTPQATDGSLFDGAGSIVNRGRRSIAIDLKKPEGSQALLRLAEKADALVEGFRPGVAERLGIGPAECLAVNRRLVYGRVTGWGQDGPLASAPGHDINFIALAGALDPIGRAGQPPVPPLNLVGDYGGGALFLAFGVVCAIYEAQRSGQGQVVDAAMVDGVASMTALLHGLRHMGLWNDERGTNLIDTGAHFYEVYETADAKFVSVGAIEPKFYAELLRLTGLSAAAADLGPQMDPSRWPALKARLAEVFKTKTRDEWSDIMEGTDVCFAPVLGLSEAPHHSHLAHRRTFTEVAGVIQPAPAPRFSRTPGAIERPPARPGEHTDEALADWGFTPDERAELARVGAIA